MFDNQGRCCFSRKNGNGSGSVRVEYLGTQNRNPNLKPEPDPNSNSGTNSNPKPKPADTRNRTDNPKPDFFSNQQCKPATPFQVSNKNGQLKCKINKQSNKHDSNYIPARHSAVRLLQIVEIITNKVAPHREHSKVQMFNTSETIEINIHGSPNK